MTLAQPGVPKLTDFDKNMKAATAYIEEAFNSEYNLSISFK